MTTETKGHETHAPHAATKPAPVDPLSTKASSLLEKIARTDERHREEVKKLREEAAELYAEAQAENLSKHHQLVFDSTQTQVDSALNFLDPDCVAAKPEKPKEAASG